MQNVIMIVEDNDDDVLVIQRGFRKAKIANPIERFVNGEDAFAYLESADRQKVELILLDLNMEVMNGFDFLKLRQTKEELRKIPVVVLTSSHRQQDIELAYELGANAYVEKPIDPKDFIEVILTIEEFWLLLAKKP